MAKYMINNSLRIIDILSVITLLLFIHCSVEGSKIRNESRTIKPDGAESVTVEINMGAGKLNLSGGAEELLEADFIYSLKAWKPKIKYNVIDNRGSLIIKQPDILRIPAEGPKYEWNINLNNNIPMDLYLELDAGKYDLKMGDLNLTNIDIKLGVGEFKIDMVGNWKSSVNTHIEGGVGDLTFNLPSNIGVCVKVNRGLGAVNNIGLKNNGDLYINDLYETSDIKLNISLNAGIGKIDLILHKEE
jgi:hypothetical protein